MWLGTGWEAGRMKTKVSFRANVGSVGAVAGPVPGDTRASDRLQPHPCPAWAVAGDRHFLQQEAPGKVDQTSPVLVSGGRGLK